MNSLDQYNERMIENERRVADTSKATARLPRLELYDRKRHDTGQNGGLVAVKPDGTFGEFWGGYDGEIPSRAEIAAIAQAVNERAALVAERDRLRADMKTIILAADEHDITGSQAAFTRIVKLARAALEGGAQ